MKTLALAAAVLLFPVVSSAQQAADPKWNAWLGCWELVLENARDAATRPSPSRRTLPQSAAGLAAAGLRRAIRRRRDIDDARREPGSD